VTGRQLLFGPGDERGGAQRLEQGVRLPQPLDRQAPLARPPQEAAVGQQQPGRIDRALRAGGLLAIGIDPPGFLRGVPLLGQPPFQPGQARPQIANLAVALAQLVQDGGGQLRLTRADQALDQQRPPQDRVRPAPAVQGRVVPPVAQRVGHAQVVAGRLVHQGPGHSRVQLLLAVIQAVGRLLGEAGVPLTPARR
jgi:hypothetical protein